MKLSEYMTAKGLSDAEMARLLGRSRTAVYRLRTCKCMPTPETMKAIARVTNGEVTPNDFYGLHLKGKTRL